MIAVQHTQRGQRNIAGTWARWVARLATQLAVSTGAGLALLASGVLSGLWRFNRLVRREVEALLEQADGVTGSMGAGTAMGVGAATGEAVTEEMLRPLPEPVQRYLRYSGVVGKPIPRRVRLTQKGAMHINPQGPGVPVSAEEYYTTEPPGFVWNATMRVGPLPMARGLDKYMNGTGYMLIKVGALVPVVDARGEEIDQGSMMRYLSEIVWFPAAFLAENISFEPVNEGSARVKLTDQGKSVEATMYFDAEGKLTDFVGERYRMVGKGYSLENWSTPVYEYGELAGLRLPVRGGAVWKLAEGDYQYGDFTITWVEYDGATG